MDRKLINIQDSTFTDVYENITSSLHESAKEAIGTQENKASNKVWWNEEIEVLVQLKKQKYKKWMNTKKEEDQRAYKEANRQLRRQINTEKTEHGRRSVKKLMHT